MKMDETGGNHINYIRQELKMQVLYFLLFVNHIYFIKTP